MSAPSILLNRTGRPASSTPLCTLAMPGAAGRDHGLRQELVGLEYASSVVVTTDAASRLSRSPAPGVRTRVLGMRGRVDIAAGNHEIRMGDHLLTPDGGQTITMVFRARREYEQITLNPVATRLASELRGPAAVSVGYVRFLPIHSADFTVSLGSTRRASQ